MAMFGNDDVWKWRCLEEATFSNNKVWHDMRQLQGIRNGRHENCQKPDKRIM